jgi:transposase
VRLSGRHANEPDPAEVAALYLAADEARWLAEDHGLSSYWEVTRLLSEALPPEIAATLESCWADAGVLPQRTESDAGYYRRLQCHTAYLREEHAEVYEEIVGLVARTREARACALKGAA